MSWAIGYDDNWQRDIGYGVPAICDSPDCEREIDRGLAYVCGGEPYGGECGCGLYFCAAHLFYDNEGCRVCAACNAGREPYEPKPDTHEWLRHKLTDESWAQWRAENMREADQIRAALSANDVPNNSERS